MPDETPQNRTEGDPDPRVGRRPTARESEPAKRPDEHQAVQVVQKPEHKRVSLAKRLEDVNRHPVLIFGGAFSGKTSLIMSIIHALTNAEEVSVSFADNEPILDPSDGVVQKQAHAIARHWYDLGMANRVEGAPMPPNIGGHFFIPIDVQPRNSTLPAVKFAILDGRGEDYIPVKENEKTATQFARKELGQDIKKLLEEFSHEITIIYIAPFSQHGSASDETKEANLGLTHVLANYLTARVQDLRINDNHLFLFTKWDEHAHPLQNKPLFSEPRSIDIVKQVQIRYKESWGQFCSLPVGGPAKNRRVFMQYSSGYFEDGFLRKPPDYVASTFERYPRTVSNWLYSRAAQSSLRQRQLEIDIPPDIFLDVSLEQPKASFADRLIALIVGDVD